MAIEDAWELVWDAATAERVLHARLILMLELVQDHKFGRENFLVGTNLRTEVTMMRTSD